MRRVRDARSDYLARHLLTPSPDSPVAATVHGYVGVTTDLPMRLGKAIAEITPELVARRHSGREAHEATGVADTQRAVVPDRLRALARAISAPDNDTSGLRRGAGRDIRELAPEVSSADRVGRMVAMSHVGARDPEDQLLVVGARQRRRQHTGVGHQRGSGSSLG